MTQARYKGGGSVAKFEKKIVRTELNSNKWNKSS